MIYLARHGQTDWNRERKIQHEGVPLNEQGRKEAEMCGQALASFKIDGIVSSDILRAQETAEIINGFLSVPVRFDVRLREAHWGDLRGRLMDEVSDEEWKTLYYHPHKIHADSLDDAYVWIKSFFDEIDATQNTLVVTHEGVIQMVKYLTQNLTSFDAVAYENMTRDFRIKNTEIFEWDKAEIFRLAWSPTADA